MSQSGEAQQSVKEEILESLHGESTPYYKSIVRSGNASSVKSYKQYTKSIEIPIASEQATEYPFFVEWKKLYQGPESGNLKDANYLVKKLESDLSEKQRLRKETIELWNKYNLYVSKGIAIPGSASEIRRAVSILSTDMDGNIDEGIYITGIINPPAKKIESTRGYQLSVIENNSDIYNARVKLVAVQQQLKLLYKSLPKGVSPFLINTYHINKEAKYMGPIGQK